MKKRLTFSFLPWAAAAGVCVGGFARGADAVPAAPTPADASVLSAADVAAETNAVAEAPAATPTSAASTPLPAALLERVASAMGPSTQAAMDAGELPLGTASTAIREVAAWLDTRGQHGCSALLREEIEQ